MQAIPKLLIELREDDGVAAIVGVNPNSQTARVRSPEPAAGVSGGYDGDVHAGTAEDPYRAFVTLRQLTAPRIGRLPVQRPRILARCFGRTYAEAGDLRWAVSHAIHNIGPRVHANGLGIYNSLDSEGGEQQSDPDTQQPYEDLFIDLLATTQAVA